MKSTRLELIFFPDGQIFIYALGSLVPLRKYPLAILAPWKTSNVEGTSILQLGDISRVSGVCVQRNSQPWLHLLAVYFRFGRSRTSVAQRESTKFLVCYRIEANSPKVCRPMHHCEKVSLSLSCAKRAQMRVTLERCSLQHCNLVWQNGSRGSIIKISCHPY